MNIPWYNWPIILSPIIFVSIILIFVLIKNYIKRKKTNKIQKEIIKEKKK